MKRSILDNSKIPFLAIIIVYVSGIFLEVMDIDEAQYAAIAREMASTGEWLQVKDRGENYLDKPPLLFWVAAISFKLLGVSNFSYRFIPLLVSLLGIYATYRFARLYYSQRAAYSAALIIASSMAFFLMHRDVRTDTMLTGWVMFSIWQIAAWLNSQAAGKQANWLYLLGGGFGLGCALLAKGPIGLAVPVLAFAAHFIYQQEWHQFFRLQWLWLILIIALMLAPMLWGLYAQYGTNGLYFYFWKQSFGRITGENEWVNDVNIFFQAQNFLWSFLPWVILFVAGMLFHIRRVVNKQAPELISLGGFVLPFISLSLSRYQLPHYTFVVFPLGAVLTGVYADYLMANANQPIFKTLRFVQSFLGFLLCTAALLLVFWATPTKAWWFWAGWVLLFFLWSWFSFNPRSVVQSLLGPSVVGMITACATLNVQVYPELFRYQAGSAVGNYMLAHQLPVERLWVLSRLTDNNQELFTHSLDFKVQRTVPSLQSASDLMQHLAQGTCYVYTDTIGMRELQALPAKVRTLQRFEKYHISMLTPEFLNPRTRQSVLQQVFLVEVKKQQ
ncbi:MAG: glycosyltransferase family 39 protein [Cytophagales bacterium]|nr:glycosyltransferase family 39 protein [Bernardetiaceae bacterium]MDW8205429.1 glycosyltransferase family 39 protein [Cytophagales bacterium]